MLDSGLVAASEPVAEDDFLPLIAALFPGDTHHSIEQLRRKPAREQLEYFVRQAAQAGIVPIDSELLGMQIFEVFQANVKAVHDYRPLPYSGQITLLRPKDQRSTGVLFEDPALGWRSCAGAVRVHEVPGDHAHML